MITGNKDVVLKLWDVFDRAAFDETAQLLHDDFVCEWPQSAERIRGRANFIAVNENYPGRWFVEVLRIIADGDQVVTECRIYNETESLVALSLFTFKDNKIINLREYWPERMASQSWRIQWVEKMDEEKNGTY